MGFYVQAWGPILSEFPPKMVASDDQQGHTELALTSPFGKEGGLWWPLRHNHISSLLVINP